MLLTNQQKCIMEILGKVGCIRRNQLLALLYRPVYDAVCRFAQQFPEKNTVNAATIGRLMNNVKLGYYPTDPDNIALMLQGISFPEGVTTNVFDKTTPRLIQFHTLKNAVNPPFLGGFSIFNTVVA